MFIFSTALLSFVLQCPLSHCVCVYWRSEAALSDYLQALQEPPKQKTVLSVQSVSISSSHIQLPPHPHLHRLTHRSFLAFTHWSNIAFMAYFDPSTHEDKVTTVISKRLKKLTQQHKVTSYKTWVFLNLCERQRPLVWWKPENTAAAVRTFCTVTVISDVLTCVQVISVAIKRVL